MITFNSANYTNYKKAYPNFTSRNKKIRRAEDITRKVNNEYPRVASSRIDDYQNIDKFMGLKRRYTDRIIQLREDIDDEEDFFADTLDNIKVLPRLVSERKIGNCAESTVLAGIAAKVNGIENFEAVGFDSSDSGEIDHVALLVNDKKNPYIIDAWLGLADYVPNVIEKYKGEYSNLLELDGNNDEKIELVPIPWGKMARIQKVSKKELQEAFPQLVLPKKNKNNVFTKIKHSFINIFKKQDSN